MSTLFTSKIIKGGALLADTRRFLEAWEPDANPTESLTRFAARRALGKTAVRQKVILDILRRRFVDPGPEVVSALRRLVQDPTAFREACYYETARTDELLAAFTGGPLYEWHRAGQRVVAVDDVNRWLATDARVPRWNRETRERVAQGLLATLRDFAILEAPVGSRRKQIPQPHLSLRGFCYVALREQRERASAKSILHTPVWRWYLLTPELVRRLFLEADRVGCLRFAEAGSIVRVDWLIKSIEEITDVIPA